MARLSRAALSAYDATLAGLERLASEQVRRRLEAYLAANPAVPVAECREFAISCVLEAVASCGDGASALAADLYDELAERAGERAAGVADATDVAKFVAKEVHYQAGKLDKGDSAGFVEGASSCASDQVSRRANATMRASCVAGGVRWARVPMGGEACGFCLMLASRGFAYRTARSAGEGGHWHRGCRCKVIPETAGEVEGC